MNQYREPAFNLNIMSDIESVVARSQRVWVFGYGSLVWKTGFKYTHKKIGFIQGYVRRFWQGCASHRGTPDSPGRVATLVKKDVGHVWGVAFELVGQGQIQDAMEHLGMRECKLGGYEIELVPFKCRDSPNDIMQCLVFNALPSNTQYLGSAPLDALANQIVDSRGPSGHNVEYVTRLAEYIREHIPEEADDHLFTLEKNIKTLLDQRNICINTLLNSQSQMNSNKWNIDNSVYNKLWKDLNTEHDTTFSRHISVDRID